MRKQSAGAGVVILMAGGLLLAGCGAGVATSPPSRTLCSGQGGWCLTLRRTATSAMVTVTCPVRSCSEATVALKRVTRPGQAYPGPEVREGLPEVAPGLHVDVAPTQAGITCNATFQAAIGGWCMSPGQNTHYETTPGPQAESVATPTVSCRGTCQSGWTVVVTGTGPGRPWSLTLPLPSVRAPHEVAE
ncbi:MAG: hypothetical protein ACYCZN_13125 [Candidatus Dormibacteria bacterium]